MCDDYDLLVLEVNVSNGDSKSAFGDYLSRNNCEYPGIWSQEGGRPISDEVGNGGSGNPKYMIYPDKTYARTSTIPPTVQPHVCGGGNPKITVKTPNGGESIEKNSAYDITWTSTKVTGNVKIELHQSGSLHSVIAASETNDDSYSWLVDNSITAGSSYSIVITSIDDPTVTDASDNTFELIEEYIISGEYSLNFDALTPSSEVLPTGFSQATSDDINWIIHTGPTPSKIGSAPDVTGPDGDHTSGSGNYIYVEASNPNNPGKVSAWESPKFDISGISNPQLGFWYHMFSDSGHMGTLTVDVFSGSSWTNGIISLSDDDYGDQWHEATCDLSSYRAGPIRFRFTGTTGSSWASDICIDDLTIAGASSAITSTKGALLASIMRIAGTTMHYSLPESFSGEELTITLFTMQGKVVSAHTQEVSKQNGIIELNSLANGIYNCTVSVGDFKATNSVVISK